MATIPKAILDLLTNSKTAKFAESLKHSDLPTGWADDPEIVDLAAKAWQEAGTESPFFKAWFGKGKVLDENSAPMPVFHGTQRGDRIGEVFRKDRATSGPMAFFTDNKDIAQNYAASKTDTSLSREPWLDDWRKQYVVQKGAYEYPVAKTYWSLPADKRAEIVKAAGEIMQDEDGNIIREAGNIQGTGGFQQNLSRSNGNPVEALFSEWLDSGNLAGEEEKLFGEVLKLAGLDNVKYKDPNFRDERVYDVFMNLQKPFDTSNINKTTLDKLYSAGKRAERQFDPNNGYYADSWDKTSIPPTEWLRNLDEDLATGRTDAWTIVPDWVTETLKKRGYDGIKDTGGKQGGIGHNVFVPFEPTQLKSVNNRGTFNPADPNIYRTLAPLGVGTAAMTASLLAGGDEAKAAAINAALADPASREKAAAAGLPYDPPVEESAWSPADLLVAPVGAVGIPAKLLAMALDAPVTLGLDAGLSALGGLFGGGDRKKPGGW